MSVTWTIRTETGEERSLADWGISDFTRTLQNLAEDYCTCTMAARALQTRLPFANRETLVINRNGVQWFVGIVDLDLPSADGRRHSAEFRINGPLWWLDRLIYRQDWTFAEWPIKFSGNLPHPAPNPNEPWDTTGLTGDDLTAQLSALRDIDNYKKSKGMSSVCILGQGHDGEFVDTSDSIRNVLAYALTQGAPFQIGNIPPGVKMPADQIRDMTCLQVIRRLLQWTPDQGSWVDYTTSPPTVHFSTITSRPVERFSVGDAGDIESIGLRARRDLQVTGVTINYLRTSTRAGLTLYSNNQDIVGETDGLGVLYATVDLSGSAMMDSNGKYYYDGAPTPSGVAQSLMDGYGLLYWQGDIKRVVDSPHPSYLNSVIAVDNARPEWATMKGVVQQQTDDITGGRVTIQLGPPAHLSPQEFVARLQASRGLRPVPSEMIDGRYDGGAATPYGPPTDGVPPKLTFGGQKVDFVMRRVFGGRCSSDTGWGEYDSRFYEYGYTDKWVFQTASKSPGVYSVSAGRHSYRIGVVIEYQGSAYSNPTTITTITNFWQQKDGSVEPISKRGGGGGVCSR